MSRNPPGEPRTRDLFRPPNPWFVGTRQHALWQAGYDTARAEAAALRAIESPAHPETGLDVERIRDLHGEQHVTFNWLDCKQEPCKSARKAAP